MRVSGNTLSRRIWKKSFVFVYFYVPIALISLTFGSQATLRLSDFPSRFVQHLATSCNTLFVASMGNNPSPPFWGQSQSMSYGNMDNRWSMSGLQERKFRRRCHSRISALYLQHLLCESMAGTTNSALQDWILLYPTRLPGQLKQLSELFSLSDAPAPSPQSFLTSILVTTVAWTIPTSRAAMSWAVDLLLIDLQWDEVAPRSRLKQG